MDPDTIYMQHDGGGDLSTWCVERINDSDLVYVREHLLAIECLEAVCRECHKSPITKRQRNYCAACGKPRAWRTGTVPLSRPEALAKARDDERERCAAIVNSYTVDHMAGPVQVAAREMLAAIREEDA